MIEQIKLATEQSNPCQRNWDHTSTIPREHIDTLIHCIRHAPTKQNETHYKAYVITNPTIIHNIYLKTKHFAVTSSSDPLSFTDNSGVTLLDYNVHNSQVNANLLIAFCDDWNPANARALIHAVADVRPAANASTHLEKEKQRFFSMGIAAGQVALAANLLGYRTGFCSAFWPQEMEEFFNGDKLKILLGVGVPHPTKNRREHEDVYNRDILAVDRRSGPDDEKWLFPTFTKNVSIQEIQ